MEEARIKVSKTARYFISGNSKTPKRIWFVLHGYGQSAAYFAQNFKKIASQEDCIIAPEGLSRFYTDGVSGRVGASWMTKEDRWAEIEDYVQYLEALREQVLSQSTNDKETQLILLGFSQGASTAWRWYKHAATDFTHLIFWTGTTPDPVGEPLPKKIGRTQTHVVFADNDKYISVEQGTKMIHRLQEHIPELHVYWQQDTHKINRETLSQMYETIRS